MGHSRKDCKEIPLTTRTCFTCNKRGHLARHCPRTHDNVLAHSKRPRTEDEPSEDTQEPLSNTPPATTPSPPITPVVIQDSNANIPAEDNTPSVSPISVSPSPSLFSYAEETQSEPLVDDDVDMSEVLTTPTVVEVPSTQSDVQPVAANTPKGSKVTIPEPVGSRRVSARSTKGVAPLRYEDDNRYSALRSDKSRSGTPDQGTPTSQ